MGILNSRKMENIIGGIISFIFWLIGTIMEVAVIVGIFKDFKIYYLLMLPFLFVGGVCFFYLPAIVIKMLLTKKGRLRLSKAIRRVADNIREVNEV